MFSRVNKVYLLSDKQKLRSSLKSRKYAHFSAADLSISAQLSRDMQRLWREWDTLEPDLYLQGDAAFRHRRFVLFYYLPLTGELLPLKSDTYFQSSKLNGYAGGVERKFEPALESTLTNPFLQALIHFDYRQLPIKSGMEKHPWIVDVHQVRIIGSNLEEGEPTPEGIHHDGEEFVCIHMARRVNVIGGESHVYDNNRRLLESHTLRYPMDSMILWDPHVMHAVNSIRPENPGELAIRDVLLIGFDPAPGLERPIQTGRE